MPSSDSPEEAPSERAVAAADNMLGGSETAAATTDEYEMSDRLKRIVSERPPIVESNRRRGASLPNISSMTDKVLLPRPSAKQAGRVSVREMNYGIPSVAQVEDHVADTHGESSWRAKTIHFIHQKCMQRTMLLLLLLDVIIIFTEMFLQSTYPFCGFIVRDCIACCPDDSGGDTIGTESEEASSSHSTLRWLAGGGGGGHDEELCDAGFQEYTGHPSCDDHKWYRVHTAEEVLFWCTITILSLFLLENLAEMVALTPCVYFKQFFMALDFFIITISLTLELTFHFVKKDVLQEIAALLVFVRIWRFVRIGHGLVEVTAEIQHEDYEDLIDYARACEKELMANNIPLPEHPDHVKELKVEDKMGKLLKEAHSLDTIGE